MADKYSLATGGLRNLQAASDLRIVEYLAAESAHHRQKLAESEMVQVGEEARHIPVQIAFDILVRPPSWKPPVLGQPRFRVPALKPVGRAT